MPRGPEALGELAIRYGLRTVAAFPVFLFDSLASYRPPTLAAYRRVRLRGQEVPWHLSRQA